ESGRVFAKRFCRARRNHGACGRHEAHKRKQERANRPGKLTVFRGTFLATVLNSSRASCVAPELVTFFPQFNAIATASLFPPANSYGKLAPGLIAKLWVCGQVG